MRGLLADGGPPRATLREMLERGEPILAPGCYDALGARLVEEAGFDAAYMTGFGTAAARLGRPDVGLLGMSEMVENARQIAAATALPVIADADTGYGNPINVIRTVQEFEAAGVAALHIEDQLMPKKCGHMENKRVIEPAEMAAKVSAAVAARRSDEFLIIARTDARAVEGLDGALERARRYRDAGADALFIEAPLTLDEVRTIARAFPDVPLLFNYAEGGKSPAVTYEQLRELGFGIVIFPLSVMLTAVGAIRGALEQIRRDGSAVNVLPSLMPFDDFLEFIGTPEINELERRFATETARAGKTGDLFGVTGQASRH